MENKHANVFTFKIITIFKIEMISFKMWLNKSHQIRSVRSCCMKNQLASRWKHTDCKTRVGTRPNTVKACRVQSKQHVFTLRNWPSFRTAHLRQDARSEWNHWLEGTIENLLSFSNSYIRSDHHLLWFLLATHATSKRIKVQTFFFNFVIIKVFIVQSASTGHAGTLGTTGMLCHLVNTSCVTGAFSQK